MENLKKTTQFLNKNLFLVSTMLNNNNRSVMFYIFKYKKYELIKTFTHNSK